MAEFQRRFGEPPGDIAAYTYDAVTVLLDAIERAGLGPDAVRAAVTKGRSLDGATGILRFVPSGDREVAVLLAEIVDGALEMLPRH
jgi:branched-chain amino acid transport system substrate-binding protein